ncbi:unnamed protein product [Durusdinium trenchii]|uniref:Calmodulin n=1 Tax=Durusdinium trenchii TaxID=1381693 RepID=A0ABP0PSR7_9DINO
MTTRAAARHAVRSQYFFVANDEEAFSVFGRQEVQDINPIRQVTDVGYLILFLAVALGMFWLDSCAHSLGNVLRLSEPIDYKGNLCGYDEEVKGKPLGYHPNPFNDMVICVSSCPETATDGSFTMPDGPMGKDFTRPAYPSANIYGQLCLPLDLSLARLMISVKSVQTELYKGLGVIFTSDGILVVLIVPFVTSAIYVVALFYIPTAATALALCITGVTLALLGVLMDLDINVMMDIPLFKETHPLMPRWLGAVFLVFLLMAHPYFRSGFYLGSLVFFLALASSMSDLTRAHAVFRECVAAIGDPNVLVTIFTSMVLSVIRISFILHVCRSLALLMSIVTPVEVELQLFGEIHWVPRTAWSPFFLRGVFFYMFGTFWTLEFLSFSNKYITAQVLCANYFHLKARNLQMQEISSGRPAPIRYALYSMFRFHLGSIAKAALMSAPCRLLRSLIGLFVPDRPNLDKSLNQQYRIAYYLFWPLIKIDLYLLRFYKDSVLVMLALKGFKYMDSARRVEGLINRSRGKIPHLTKFTSRIETFLKVSVGLTSMIWAFFLFREPRRGAYHQVEELKLKDSVANMFVTPQHSPLLSMPVLFFFGLWVGDGMLHLVTMASNALTICYCIDVEMVGGTETDALYAPQGLKLVYRDLGGGESERELAVRYFFRSYNVPEEIADKFFDFLDEEKRGELDYGRVVNFLRPFLEGAINGTPLTARDLTKGKGAPDYLLEEMLDATDEGETRLALFDHQFEATLRLLAQKVIDRFGTTAAAFRFVDLDRNGIMTRNETRYLFRLVNFPEDLADKFHDSVDTNGSGEISLQEFYASLAPYVDIQERPVAKREDFVLKPDTPETPDEVPSRAVSKEWTKFVQNSQRVELRRLMQDIGDKLQLKFKHVRDAFKPLNLQRLGRITRAEMRSFFRGFGHPQEVADRVYDLLQDKRGEVEYAVFMSHFESVLGRDFRQVSQPPILEMGDFLASREVDGTIETFKRFLITKCRNLQEAYRVIDGDKDGKVSRQEMRLFAKRLGVPSARADQLFDALDVEGLGSINYLQFTRLFPETWERPDPGTDSLGGVTVVAALPGACGGGDFGWLGSALGSSEWPPVPAMGILRASERHGALPPQKVVMLPTRPQVQVGVVQAESTSSAPSTVASAGVVVPDASGAHPADRRERREPLLSVQLPAERLERHGPVTFFAVDVRSETGAWRVMRRYTDFWNLKEQLGVWSNYMPGAPFPRKHFLQCKGCKLERRRAGLETWLQKVISKPRGPHREWKRLVGIFLESSRQTLDAPVAGAEELLVEIEVPEHLEEGQLLGVTMPDGRAMTLPVPKVRLNGAERGTPNGP